jgi:hypothetical protein
MDRETAYRIARALTADARGTWVPVPLDYFTDQPEDGKWCILNALHPEPIPVPTVHMWEAVRRFERKAAEKP